MIKNLRLDIAWVYFRTNKNAIIHSLLTLSLFAALTQRGLYQIRKLLKNKNKVPPGERLVKSLT